MKIHIFLKDKWLPKVLMAALLATPLWGSAQTEIADKPVFSSSDAEIKPNVMLLMDTSDSMAWSHMPDDLVKPIDTVTFYRQPVGYKNHLCNAMYYNPEQSYPLPIGADGKPLPEPSFTAAYYNYYLDPSVKVDLSNAFRAHDSLTIKDQLAKEDLPQEAYYYEFSGTNPAINSLTAYANKPCRDDDFYEKAGDPLKKAATGGGEWIRKTPKTVAEQKNFAIWYSYYRTRMLMAKSAVQSAFSSIPEGRYRVGFISVDPKDKATKNVDPAKYVKIADFGGVARQAWFNKVSSQVAEGYSPAREGLARVGRLYGGKFDLINQGIPAADDPLLADDGKTLISCRPNFTILTTDGYWNKVSERDVFERFDLPGTQKVGGTDNLLTGDGVCNKTGAACTPRGIFDGAQDGASYEKRKATLYEFTSSGCSLGLRKYEQVSYMRKEVKKYVRSMETTGGNIVLDMAVKTTKKNETQKFQNRLVETEYKVVPTNAKMVQIQYQGICGEAVCALPDCSPATISKYSVTSCAPKTLVDKYITLAEAKACQNTDTSSPSFKHPYVITQCTTGGNVICRDNVSDSSKPGFVAGCTPPVVKRDLILAKGDLCTNQSAQATEPKTTEIVCSEVTQPSVGSVSCPALSYDPSTKTYTRCVTTQYAPSRVPASSCTPSLGSAANGFIETSCVYYCSDPSKCPSTGGGSAAKGRYCPNGAKLPGIGPDGKESFEWCGTANVSPATVVDPLTCTPGVVDTAGDKTYTDCIPVTQSKNYTTSCDWSGKKKTTNAANEPTVTECGEENDPGYKITKRTSTIWRDEYAPPAAPGPWSSVSWSASTDETDCKKNVLPPADWPKYGVAIPPGAPLAGNPFPRYQYKDEGTETIAPVSSTGGSFNSLADVSQYYYRTDLRPSLADDVRPIGTNWYSDTATHQHMTTFVLGLGVSGQKRYQEDYLTAATGDFADIRAGKSNWPIWPAVGPTALWTAYHDPRSIDDFWHAAVNGRGKYFRASDPQSVVAGLSEALAQIGSTLATGSGTSVPNSPQNIGSGADKFTLSTSYNAGNWTGELTYNTWKNDKELSPQAVWSAQAKLQTQVDVDCDDRRIYVKDGSQLVQFAKGTKVCTGGLTLDSIPTAIANALNLTSLNQYTAMTNGSGGTALQQQAVTVASFVNYIRGHKKNEGYAINNVDKLYRSREFVLGDIAGSVPTYVAGPKESYVDAGYVAFKEAKKSRKPVVYVGANDGMLHAFNADASDAAKGKELWAYIPSQVIPNLIHLAGDNYKYNHRFYVDGTPIVGDVKINNDWKTILVGGLNAGGNGYYALDVTDPDSPKALWEFTTHVDSEVGLSFGEPRIVKLEDGRWVVLVSSGHNNSTGKGYLYVLSAETGQVLHKIATNVGSAVSPSGLTHISPYMTYKGLTAKVSHVYAGDLFGNVWRFDMSGSTAFTAKKLTQLKDSGGKEQPITTEIQAIKNEGQVRLFIGTGKLLDFSDLAQVSDVQSIYGIVDTSSTSMDPAYDAALKAGMGRTVLAQLSSTSAGATISIACKAQCDAVTKTPWSGWYFDLPEKGERINVNMQTDPLGQNLAAVSNYPAQGSVNNVCKSNVASSLYVFNLLTSKGSGVKNSTAAVALPIYTTGENADGNSVIYVQPMSSNPETKLPAVELSQVRKAAGQKRISWREVVQQ